MADEIDLTVEREEKGQALWQQQRDAIAARPKLISEDCEECGERIPAQRQIATGGCSLCVDCAERQELQRRHYR